MTSKQSVLIVDSSAENCEVLQTALERRGLRTLVADCLPNGLELARRYEPDLIVLDLETEGCAPGEVPAGFLRQARRHRTPMVMLGAIHRSAVSGPCREFVAKPYHYGPLIRKIEELLGATGQSSVRAA